MRLNAQSVWRNSYGCLWYVFTSFHDHFKGRWRTLCLPGCQVCPSSTWDGDIDGDALNFLCRKMHVKLRTSPDHERRGMLCSTLPGSARAPQCTRHGAKCQQGDRGYHPQWHPPHLHRQRSDLVAWTQALKGPDLTKPPSGQIWPSLINDMRSCWFFADLPATSYLYTLYFPSSKHRNCSQESLITWSFICCSKLALVLVSQHFKAVGLHNFPVRTSNWPCRNAVTALTA